MRASVQVFMAAVLLLPAMVMCKPLGQECVGKECDYFERHAKMMEGVEDEREPTPDGYAVHLNDKARTFQVEFDKISRMVEILRGSGGVSDRAMNRMNSQLNAIDNLYNGEILATLQDLYPFIENTRTAEYSQAIQSVVRNLSLLKQMYNSLLNMVKDEGRAAGVYGQLFPQSTVYQTRTRTYNRPSTNHLDLLRRLQATYGRKRRETDLDDEMMEFAEQLDDVDSSVF